jgi:hypothetical protein
MKTIMELVSAQIKPRRSPYRVKPCELFDNEINISGRNFSLSLDRQLLFSYKGYSFIMLKDNGIWHFMCEQTETSKDPLTIPLRVEIRAYRHMVFIVDHFSPEFVWKLERLQMLESIVLN